MIQKLNTTFKARVAISSGTAHMTIMLTHIWAQHIQQFFTL